MNSHTDIQQRLAAYCGGELEAAERLRIEAHLNSCPTCRAELADMKVTLRLIRTTPQVEAPPWMTSRIMARLREEQGAKRSWLQRIWFPQQTAFPVKILALLLVCLSGYYLSRTVESDLKLAQQQQLQELPGQPAPLPATAPPQTPTNRDRLEDHTTQPSQGVAPHAVVPQATPRPESPPRQAPTPAPSTPAPATYAPAPPASKEQFGGKSEALKAAPGAESSNRAQDAMLEKKSKSMRRLELNDDAAAPGTADRAAGAATTQAPPQTLIRLVVDDPAAAPAMIREAVSRSGGSIREDQGAAARRMTIRIPASRQAELLERLQRLGKITQRPTTATAGATLLELTIQW